DGCIVPGAHSTWRSVWTNSYTGQQISVADFSAHVTENEGRLRIQIEDCEEAVVLSPRPRTFGGHQWYFICPVMNRCCSVLWRPPGTTRFYSREAWGSRRVAYASQFLDPGNRAHRGKAKIKARLIGDCDPDEWDLPAKPRWMRWRTYNRY